MRREIDGSSKSFLTSNSPLLRSHFSLLLIVASILSSSTAHAAVFPGATWAGKTPAEEGIDPAGLALLSDYLGGRGCVVRHGYMIYTWGDPSKRADVASACKPWYTHFMLKAVESGLLAGPDVKVVDWEPCLNSINASLGFKDRNITFRHMVNQISCYGVTEAPGAAFDYNDYQTALLFDTLFLKVYGATYNNVDANVLHPLLTDILQCEDNPTFLAFGINGRPGRVGISVRDFARFGYLYLRRGNWKEKQILSPSNVKLATTNEVPNSIPRTARVAAQMCPGQRSIGGTKIPDDQADHLGSYSYYWWTNGRDQHGRRHWPDAPLDTYGAFGHANGKRAVVVMPSLDIVVSWNDTTLDQKSGNPQNEAFKRLMAAVRDAPIDGQIVVDPSRPAFFKRHNGGPFFMCGPGDPEDFLYRGTRNADGTRTGDQNTLINKMIGTGANCIYIQAVRSHGGDGDSTQNPCINSDINQALDDDILNQWEGWFTTMDNNNIVIFFFIYDDDASPFGVKLPAGVKGRRRPNLDSREASLIDKLVNRFKHHKNLIWCVAEEYAEGLSAAHAAKVAERIQQADSKRHPVAIHQNNGTSFDFNGNSDFNQFAVQWNVGTPAQLHRGALAAWKNVGGLANVNMSEFADSTLGSPPRAGTGTSLRLKNWAIAMAGAYAMDLGMDIASTPLSDLQDCGRLVRFMEATRFSETFPRDDLARGNTDFVLADPGDVYIAYADSGASLGVSMVSGSYSVKWYNPTDGAWVDNGIQSVATGDRTFVKPVSLGNEAALYLTLTGPATTVPADFDIVR